LLDLDLGSIDTSFPVIKTGMADLVVKECKIERNSANDGDLWTIKSATTKVMKGIKGEDIKEGAIIFHRISLTPTDKYDVEAILKNVARFTQAIKPQVAIKVPAFINAIQDGSIATMVKLFEGRQFTVKLEALPEGVDKKSGRSLPPRNEISQFDKAK
jgi:hypothetical protein